MFGEGGALTKYRSPLNFEEMLTFVLSQEEPLLHVHLVVINTDNCFKTRIASFSVCLFKSNPDFSQLFVQEKGYQMLKEIPEMEFLTLVFYCLKLRIIIYDD